MTFALASASSVSPPTSERAHARLSVFLGVTGCVVEFAQAHVRDHTSEHNASLGCWRLPFVAVLHGAPPELHAALHRRLEALTTPPALGNLEAHHAAALGALLVHMALLRRPPPATTTTHAASAATTAATCVSPPSPRQDVAAPAPVFSRWAWCATSNYGALRSLHPGGPYHSSITLTFIHWTPCLPAQPVHQALQGHDVTENPSLDATSSWGNK